MNHEKSVSSSLFFLRLIDKTVTAIKQIIPFNFQFSIPLALHSAILSLELLRSAYRLSAKHAPSISLNKFICSFARNISQANHLSRSALSHSFSPDDHFPSAIPASPSLAYVLIYNTCIHIYIQELLYRTASRERTMRALDSLLCLRATI